MVNSGEKRSITDDERMHQSTDAKKIAWEGDKVSRGQIQSGTDIATTRPKRPKGRFGENKKIKNLITGN